MRLSSTSHWDHWFFESYSADCISSGKFMCSITLHSKSRFQAGRVLANTRNVGQLHFDRNSENPHFAWFWHQPSIGGGCGGDWLVTWLITDSIYFETSSLWIFSQKHVAITRQKQVDSTMVRKFEANTLVNRLTNMVLLEILWGEWWEK